MQAIEFVSKAHDGVVDLPSEYQGWNGKKVRAILLDDMNKVAKRKTQFKAATLSTRGYRSIAKPPMSVRLFPDTNIAELRDARIFQQVRIELGALSWPNGADLDPSWVHEEIGKNKTWVVPV